MSYCLKCKKKSNSQEGFCFGRQCLELIDKKLCGHYFLCNSCDKKLRKNGYYLEREKEYKQYETLHEEEFHSPIDVA